MRGARIIEGFAGKDDGGKPAKVTGVARAGSPGPRQVFLSQRLPPPIVPSRNSRGQAPAISAARCRAA